MHLYCFCMKNNNRLECVDIINGHSGLLPVSAGVITSEIICRMNVELVNCKDTKNVLLESSYKGYYTEGHFENTG